MRLFPFVFCFFITGVLLAPSVSHANNLDLRNYQFTADFINCVNRFESEGDRYDRPGNAVSGLMNGNAVFSGPLGSDYWSYMDCLQPTGSSSLNVDEAQICPGLSLPVNGRTVYVPPGANGKTIGLAGRYWECQGEQWVRLSSLPDYVDGTGGDIPDPNKDACSGAIISKDQCQFNLGESEHGRVVEKQFGRFFGDDTSFNGRAIARCNNGSYETVELTCSPSSCKEGEVVRWGDSAASAQGQVTTSSRCEGEVRNGVAEQSLTSVRYYSSPEMARDRTVILSGYAEFACHNDRWVPLSGSVCERKPPDEMSCQSARADNGSAKFYCE
jgi:hypothetical protein